MRTVKIVVIAIVVVVAWSELVMFGLRHIPVVQSYQDQGPALVYEHDRLKNAPKAKACGDVPITLNPRVKYSRDLV